MTLSSKEHYRYILFREVQLEQGSPDNGVLVFIMLNPSTATTVDTGAKKDNDQTIRKSIGFAKRWGYGRVLVVNLFAVRATKPEKLKTIDERVGLGNDDVVRVAVAMADRVVCAWGDSVSKVSDGKDRVKEVRAMIESQGKTPYRLGAPTKKDNPRHPSRLPGDTKPMPWN